MKLAALFALIPAVGLAQIARENPSQPLPDTFTQLPLTAKLEIPSPVPGLAAGHGPTGPVNLSLVSPREGEVLSKSDVSVSLTLTGYELFLDGKTNSGQALRLILDDDAARQDVWSVSGKAVFKNVPPGTHTIRAFPVRPWGEAIRDRGAFARVTFSVRKADGKNSPAAGAPLLTYNEPLGPYSGPRAQKLGLDFLVTGARVSKNGVHLRYSIDGGAPAEVFSWRPVWWEHGAAPLAPGKHTVRLELLDSAGKPVEGIWNSVQKEFELR
jgi:hypothetical protein